MLHLILAISLNSIPEPDKGRYLYAECRAALVEHPTIEEVERGNICIAYLEGFMDGKTPEYRYGCLFGIPYLKLVADYVERMQKEPRYLDMSKRWGMSAALDYSCLQKK